MRMSSCYASIWQNIADKCYVYYCYTPTKNSSISNTNSYASNSLLILIKDV